MRSIISAILWIITLLVSLRFGLLLIGASPDNVFISWIYGASSPLVAPFTGILGQPTVIAKGLVIPSIFDWASLLALIVYGLIGTLFSRVSSGIAHHVH